MRPHRLDVNGALRTASMKTLRFLFARAPQALLLTTLLSVLGGACNAALIAIVHQALIDAPQWNVRTLGWLFLLFVVGKLISSYASELTLVRSAQAALAQLRLALIRQLQHVPFREFERLGTARVLTALTDDVAILSGTTYQLPSFAVNVAVALGGAGYLAYLSWPLLLVSAVFTAVGAGAYWLAIRRARTWIDQARTERERLKGTLIAFTSGIKELKVHRGRRHAHTSEVGSVTDRLMSLDVRAHARFTFAHLTTQVSLFGLIGAILFWSPGLLEVSGDVLSGYVLSALFLLGPVTGLAAAVPAFSRASIALNRIEGLGVSLHRLSRETMQPSVEPEPAVTPGLLELNDVVCRYDGDESPFTLGPLDLRVEPGELLFISGGNGSGKSTLAKLLVGLYRPDSGDQRYDGVSIDDSNRDDYRQHFSVIFADYYLFDSLAGLPENDLERRAKIYLNRLELESKVTVERDQLSTTQLSQGQRKRLALLAALLEDRPVYVFDEWASDQDPPFKELFYRSLLPELKRRGKTVIVISHDDRYFDVADRHLRMWEGRFE